MAVKYFSYLAFKYYKAIYFGRFICSILNTRHRNLVGFFDPPYSPPTVFIFMALSINVSALRAKHSYFQYLLLNILFLISLSITCIDGLSDIFDFSFKPYKIDYMINKYAHTILLN
jgi:hypothetical protein